MAWLRALKGVPSGAVCSEFKLQCYGSSSVLSFQTSMEQRGQKRGYEGQGSSCARCMISIICARRHAMLESEGPFFRPPACFVKRPAIQLLGGRS